MAIIVEHVTYDRFPSPVPTPTDTDTPSDATTIKSRKRERERAPSRSFGSVDEEETPFHRLRRMDATIREMDAEIDVLRQQLEEAFAALRHLNDHAEALAQENERLSNELFVADEKVCLYESKDDAKAVNEMEIIELVGVADRSRRVLDVVKSRISAWCSA
jgi:chromosome segregation ATPase